MNTITKINRNRYDALRSAVAYRFCDTNVKVYESGTTFDEDVLRWTVNWSAIGDQPTSVVREFIEELEDAARIADALNEMNLALEYEADQQLAELLEGDREEASRRWVKFKMEVARALDDITVLDPSTLDTLYDLLIDHQI